MCLIIDTCVLPTVLDDSAPVGKLVLRWLLRGGGILARGGQLTAESDKVGRVELTLRTLRQAGRLFEASTHDPAAFQAALEHYAARCTSNDAHVLAVAHVSGARTLATNDQALTKDFKNADLLPRPRGRVFHDERQAHLLKHDVGCRNPPAKQAGTRKRPARPK